MSVAPHGEHLHVASDLGTPPARADEPVADQVQSVAPEGGIVGALTDGAESDVMLQTVAALYVDPKGVYANLPGVEVWDEARDARLYAGPWPVVAHPPCARWSRLAGFVEHVHGYKRGEDGGCFEAALRAVQTYGGVLEHPAYSKAWDTFGLPEPQTREGWTLGFCGGWSAYVEQGRYGFPLKKATWLYIYGVELPPLRWGYTPDAEGEGHNDEWGGMHGWSDIVSKSAASATPTEFRDVLIQIARAAARTARSAARELSG